MRYFITFACYGARFDGERWARHGSTRWLRKDEDVRRALQYVIDEQGKPMALFVAEEP